MIHRVVFNPKRVLAAMLAALLLVILACGGAEEATPTPTPTVAAPISAATPTPTATLAPATSGDWGEEPTYGGTIRDWNRVRSLDEGTVAGSPSEYNQMHLVWSMLLRYSIVDRATIECDMCESWSVSDDGTVYNFKLRDNLIDHSGRQWKAWDVAYPIWRYMARPNDAPFRRILCYQQSPHVPLDPDGPAAGTGIEIIGDLELRINLEVAVGWFLPCLAQHFSIIGNGELYKPIDESGTFRELSPDDGEIIGTGPYKLVSYDRGNLWIAERHDQYFKEGLPYIDRVETANVTENATKFAGIRSEQWDGYLLGDCCSINLTDTRPVKRALGDKVTVFQMFGYGHASYIANHQRPPLGPTDDPTARQIRKAIQLYIDRTLENDLLFDGIARQIFFYWCAFDFIYTCDEWYELPGFTEDPAKKALEQEEAREIMRSLGYGPDNMLKLEILGRASGITRSKVESTQEELKGMYIDASLRFPPSGETTYEDEFAGRFDMVSDVSGYGLRDPVNVDQNKYLPLEMGSENYGRWVNDKFIELYRQQLPLADDAERGRIYREMVGILLEDLPVFPMNRMAAVPPYLSRVKGYYPKAIDSDPRPLEAVWIGNPTQSPIQKVWDVYDSGRYSLDG